MQKKKQTKAEFVFQALFSFVLPILVLTRFSGKNQLGPVWGLVVALTFPIVYELSSIFKRRKISVTSLIVIGGILVTGGLGLLKINEFWLALRRAVPYLLIGLAVIGSQLAKRPLVEKFVEQVIDVSKVDSLLKQKNQTAKAKNLYKTLSLLATILFLAIAAANYALTRFIITSQPLSQQFNQELAKLRIYSIGAVTVPLVIGCIALTVYLFAKLEKLTGLSSDDIAKK